MARFYISSDKGRAEPQLEFEQGEVLTPEMVVAYSWMQASDALATIADKLDSLTEHVGRIASALEDD